MLVYILLYNVGTDNEGIHTLQTAERNLVLMFESEDDAIRYGLMLEAQDFPCPSVEKIDSEEIEEFCLSAGYDCKIVEAGTLAIPPEYSVNETDWNMEGDYSPENNINEESTGEMSSQELDYIRRQLEKLL
jgi:hypothetical protein